MTIISGLANRLRSYLAQRFGLFNAAISEMSQRLRTTIASHVANNIAGAIQELVENTITPPVPPRTRFLSAGFGARK